MQEIWKDIKGYEGRYQVSNLGRVKSLGYNVVSFNKLYFYKREKMLTPTSNGNGYMIIRLAKDLIKKNYYIHRLVAETFIPNPNNKKEINHIDKNKSNNVFTNLEWVSHRENIDYSKEDTALANRTYRKTRKSNTGYKYISYNKKEKKYKVNVLRKYYGSFELLEDAIKLRDSILKEVMKDGKFNTSN